MLIIFSISSIAVCDNAKNLIGSGIDAEDFEVADLDGDGDLDVAAVLPDDNEIRWFRNNGQGAFTSIIIDPNSVKPADVVISDIDSDGDLDIAAVIETDGDVKWYENINNVFTEIDIDLTLTLPVSIDAGDMDGDNDIDIIVAGFNDNEISIFENDGSESFSETVLSSSKPAFIEVIDFDGDNDLDIAVTSAVGDLITWQENLGSLSFTERIIDYTIESPLYATIGDFDGDGDLDLASAPSDHNPRGFEKNQSMFWYQNDGFMTFTRIEIIGNETFDIHNQLLSGDVDNDGDLDIIVSSALLFDFVAVYFNDGSATFTQVNITTSASNPKGVGLADLTGDGLDDIIYSSQDDNELAYFDNARCQDIVSLQFQSCDFPTLFCDNFNYDVPLMSNINNRWLIQLGAGQLNSSFTPIDNELALTNTQNIFPYHETDPFAVTYRPDSGSKFTRHYLSPIFSSEFVLNFNNNTDNQFFYTAFEKQTITAYSIKAEMDSISNSSGNMNWYYMNKTQPSVVWEIICGNCTSADRDISIKINSLFQQRDDFPFNSSIDDDEIRIYADNILLGTIEDFLDSRTTYISQYEFGKLSDGNYTIDDYFVMVGTDRDISTFEQYFSDIFRNDTKQIIEIADAETGDMAAALATIWDDMGLKSYASRIMTGLFLMVLLALIMFGMALKTGHPLSAGILIVVELFFMVLLTFIKLLPIWLPFVVVLVAAGIGAAIFKMGTAT